MKFFNFFSLGKNNREVTIFTVLLFWVFSCHATEYARPAPVSWDELQTIKLDFFAYEIELRLSDQCPNNIEGFENYKSMGVNYGYIFFTNYFWTEYYNGKGEVCIIKHSNFDTADSDIEILTKEESKILFTAYNIYGFSNETKKVLNAHLLLQKRAIRENETLKYGGSENIRKFIENHEVELKVSNHIDFDVEGEKYFSSKSISLVQYLESKYSQKTLTSLIENVKLSPPNRLSNGKYPFKDIESLILEAKADVNKGFLTIDQIFNFTDK